MNNLNSFNCSINALKSWKTIDFISEHLSKMEMVKKLNKYSSNIKRNKICLPFQSIYVDFWTRVNQKVQLLLSQINCNRGETIVPDKSPKEKISNKVALLKQSKGQNNMEMITSKNKRTDNKSWCTSWDSNSCSSINNNSNLFKRSRNNYSKNKQDRLTLNNCSFNNNNKTLLIDKIR